MTMVSEETARRIADSLERLVGFLEPKPLAQSLLRPATKLKAEPVEVRLTPMVRYPDGSGRALTDAEWAEAKKAWGRPLNNGGL